MSRVMQKQVQLLLFIYSRLYILKNLHLKVFTSSEDANYQRLKDKHYNLMQSSLKLLNIQNPLIFLLVRLMLVSSNFFLNTFYFCLVLGIFLQYLSDAFFQCKVKSCKLFDRCECWHSCHIYLWGQWMTLRLLGLEVAASLLEGNECINV